MPSNDKAVRVKAQRRHYLANMVAMKAKAKRHTTQQRLRLGQIVNKLKDKPCCDCGQKYPPYVMDFDHITKDKDRPIARLVNAGCSVERLMKEIAKCEVVCSNCHRERTYQRGFVEESGRPRLPVTEEIAGSNPVESANV